MFFIFQNGSDDDEVEKVHAKTIAKFGWKIAKMILKKTINMFDWIDFIPIKSLKFQYH